MNEQTDYFTRIAEETNLQEFLVSEMISRIQLEDENVIDAGWPPSIRIDTEQKNEQKY